MSLPAGIFDNNKQLLGLNIGYNRIVHFHHDTFKNLANLDNLHLAGNKLTHLPQGIFRNNTRLYTLSFENNLLEKVPENLLKGMKKLRIIGFARNKLQSLPDGLFKDTRNLVTLFLGMNNISTVDLTKKSNLKYLMIHQNSITSKSLSRSAMNTLTWLMALWASYNNIEHIPDYAFLRNPFLNYILLNNNKLKRISSQTFFGTFNLLILFLSGNPIEYIADRAFFSSIRIQRLYLSQTKIKCVNRQWFSFSPVLDRGGTAVQIYPTEQPETLPPILDFKDLVSGFRSAGFQCKTIQRYAYCTPCLSGSYITYDIDVDNFLCISCPAGGFYQDSLAFYGEREYGNGCQMCDNGTFVRKAPGRRKKDCKPCPEGTKSNTFAGFRACRCQVGFYRLDRFDKCYACPDVGVTCYNESMTLKPGYYWQWISQLEKDHYVNFTNNLQIFDDNYIKELNVFNGSFPKHYQCPRSLSCLGGLDANCAEGYTGPLCAVCDKKHYKLVATCFKCPKLHWLIFQICAISLVVMVIIFVIIKGKQRKAGDQRSLTDIILARFKIIVSFYQISSGTLDAFSYVQWPSALTMMSQYAKFVQLNILQIAPLHCFNSRLKMDAYSDLVITCSLTAAVILTALLYYNLKRLDFCSMNKTRGKSSIHSALDGLKEACYRNVFLFLFVTYPQTCSTIFQMLPAACHRICQDSSQTQCTFYLKADYSITCFTNKYNRYVILAYAALIYPFAVPLLTVTVLWKYHYKATLIKHKNDKSNENTDEASCSQPITINQNNQTNQTSSTSNSSKEHRVIRMRNGHLDVIPEERESTAFQNESTNETVMSLRKENFHKENRTQHPPKNPDEIKISYMSIRKGAPFSWLTAAVSISKTKKVVGKVKMDSGQFERRRSGRFVVTTIPIVAGMSFIFENYAEDCWFWETLEMTRKLLLTSSLALIGAEGRTSLGVASILSGCYAILHAHFMPIPDKFEHILQLTSLLVTFANTCIGMMLKIDQGALLDADAKIMDSLIITVLLVMANVMVTALVVVKYSVVVGRSIYSIIKNPRCSLACCLSVMLTIDEVQSEARSMEGNSGWRMKTQLKHGNEFEGLEVEDAAGDYGLTGVEIDNVESEFTEDQKKEDEEKSDDDEEERKNSSKTFGRIGRINLHNVKWQKGSIIAETTSSVPPFKVNQ